MPASPNANVDLVVAADALAYLTAAKVTYGGDLQALVTAVSAIIQSYISRAIPSQSHSFTVDGRGGNAQLVRNYPITAVASVSVDGVAISPAADATQSGFVFSTTEIKLRGYRFCRGVMNVAIAYTGGFTTIPADLKQACFEGIEAVVAAAQSQDPRATMLKAGDSAIAFGHAADMAQLVLTPSVTSILSQWRRVAPI